MSANSRNQPSARDAAWHLALGRALRPLRDEGVLVIGSGGATHNLGLYMYAGARGDDAPPPEWVAQFDDWVAEAIDGRHYDDLLHYRERAPYAAENHPTAGALPAVVRAARRRMGRRAGCTHSRELRSRLAVARLVRVRL